jgi:hypothetical protein
VPVNPQERSAATQSPANPGCRALPRAAKKDVETVVAQMQTVKKK